MSDQTAANTPSEPRLCKMGCGFFGNGATDGCCSKCWRDMQKKQEVSAPAVARETKPAEPVVEPPQPMDVEPTVEAPAKAAPAPAPTVTKKKKKKTSYKNMMASMMVSKERDTEKEKESLRKVTGGGTFSKIDKI